MFSSSYNINPFPQIPSSSSSFHAPFTDAEAAGAAGFIPFHHQHDPLLAGYYIPGAAAGAIYNTAPHQVFHNLGVLGHHDLGGVAYKNIKKDDQENGGGGELGNRKGAPRKDRHSKISTSQGLRDRRVRLSIGISREFFDLQDMLGFDTASKTLEWLLGKSRKDIQELEEKIKNKSIRNASSSSDHDQESNEDEEGRVPSEKKVKKSQKEAVARECRAKARERARERTREKLCTSTSTCSTKSCPHHHHYHNHHSNPDYHGLTQLGSHNHNNMASFLGVHEKPSSSNSQQLREESARIIQRNKLMVNPAESSKGFVDWDISNAIRRSSICSATNLSTELQMYGKP